MLPDDKLITVLMCVTIPPWPLRHLVYLVLPVVKKVQV